MNNSSKILFLILVSILFQSCTPLRGILNKNFPPLSTTDQQYSSIERNLSGLTDFEPHIGLNINKDIIMQYLPAKIKEAAEASNNENVIVQSLEPKLSFDKQGIFIDADFSIQIPKQNLEIKGNFIGVTAVSTELDSLYLRSALSSLNIKKIKFTKKTSLTKKALAKIIYPILKNYIENLNGQFFKKPTVIYTGWGDTYKLKLKEMFKDPSIEVIADSIKVSRFIKKSSIRVNSNGISLMIKLGKEKQKTDTLILPFTKTRTDTELTKIFNTFNEKYDNCWLTVFEPIDKIASLTTNISKNEISNILNEALSKPITLKKAFNIPPAHFDQPIEMKKSDIDCEKVRTHFECEPFCCEGGCNWSCRVHVLGGSFDDPVCLANRNACKVVRETKRVVWQAKCKAEQIAHNISDEAKCAACRIEREAVGFMELGNFKGDISGNGKAIVNLQSFNFNDNLSEITLKYDGGIDATIKSNLGFNSKKLGYVFLCVVNYDKSISSTVNLNIPEATSKINIVSSREGENLNLHLNFDKIKYNASMNPNPLRDLLRDPKFRIQCPFIGTLLEISIDALMFGKFLGMVKLGPEQELLLTGKVKGEYELHEMQIPFKPIAFKINGEEKKSQIFWNSKSIQFTYQNLKIENKNNLDVTKQTSTSNINN